MNTTECCGVRYTKVRGVGVAKKRKKSCMKKRARAGVVGLRIGWYEQDPLSGKAEVIPGGVSHKSPIMRLVAAEIMRDHSDWITKAQPFLWLVSVTCVFDYPNGVTQKETRELKAFCRLGSITDHAMEAVEEMFRHGDMSCYRHTEFSVECLGVK